MAKYLLRTEIQGIKVGLLSELCQALVLAMVRLHDLKEAVRVKLTIHTVYDSTEGVVVVGYYDSAANYSRASVNTISGTSFSTGTPVNIYSSGDIVLGAAYDSSAERVLF